MNIKVNKAKSNEIIYIKLNPIRKRHLNYFCLLLSDKFSGSARLGTGATLNDWSKYGLLGMDLSLQNC